MSKYKFQFNDYQAGCFSLFTGTDEVKIKYNQYWLILLNIQN